MTTLLAVLGLQTSFWSAVAAYLTSARQGVLSRRLPAWLGWGVFALGSVVSVLALTAAHDRLTAIVYWLSAVAISWLSLVLVTPHVSRKAVLLSCGAGFMLAAAVLG